MFKNYLLIAFRNLKRNKLFSGLNIFGLGTGLACSLLIFLWVQDEVSYDRFNTHERYLYRVTARLAGVEAAVTPAPLTQAVRGNIEGITNATKLVPIHSIVTVGDQAFDEKNIFYADTNFLRMFSYPLVQGNKEAALSSPTEVVLTQSLAVKYFGTENAIGRRLHVANDSAGSDLVVSAILKDIPANSHLHFDMLIPMLLYDRTLNSNYVWGNYEVYTYLQVDDHFNATALNLRSLERSIDALYKQNDNTNSKGEFFLQPLRDIHLHSHLLVDVEGQGNLQHVTIFSLVAVFILVIACINFMNLSTALAGQRTREVGLRKTLGALRLQLIIQFLVESVLVSFVALLIGVGLAWLLLPVFNEVASKKISVNLPVLQIIPALVGVILVVGLLSGSYPALYLSSFRPVKVLKGLKMLQGQKSFFRNGLVVVQFAISVVLIVATLVVSNQLELVRKRDIGFDKENLMYLQIPQNGDVNSKYQVLKASLNKYSGTSNYTLISNLPTYLTSGTANVHWQGEEPHEQSFFANIQVDENFLKVFRMKLVAGTFFSYAASDSVYNSRFVVNETALRTMKLDMNKAIGKRMMINGQEGGIMGVVRDFNFKPIQHPIEPLILSYTGKGQVAVIRTSPDNLAQVIPEVKAAFHDVSDYPFSYGFVNEDLNKLYLPEQQMGKLFKVFSFLSIVVSCLGLFGLATFSTQRRLKEIGVRRVLGASTGGILVLLVNDFLKLVVISLAIAFPIAWWTMDKWLDNYSYRIHLSWWIFLVAGAIALLIALITISYQSIKAVLTNPVKSLRTE
jgi:putative ABC transport system permease protein